MFSAPSSIHCGNVVRYSEYSQPEEAFLLYVFVVAEEGSHLDSAHNVPPKVADKLRRLSCDDFTSLRPGQFAGRHASQEAGVPSNGLSRAFEPSLLACVNPFPLGEPRPPIPRDLRLFHGPRAVQSMQRADLDAHRWVALTELM